MNAKDLLQVFEEHEEGPLNLVVLQIDERTAPASLLSVRDAVVRAARLFSAQPSVE